MPGTPENVPSLRGNCRETGKDGQVERGALAPPPQEATCCLGAAGGTRGARARAALLGSGRGSVPQCQAGDLPKSQSHRTT